MINFEKEYFNNPYYFYLKNKGNKISLYYSVSETLNEAKKIEQKMDFDIINENEVKSYISNVLKESNKISMEDITNELNNIKSNTGNLNNENKKFIKLLISLSKNYIINNKINITKEELVLFKKQPKEIINLIPKIIEKLIPGKLMARKFLTGLNEKLEDNLKSKEKKIKSDGEIDELVDSDGSLSNSSVPILQQGLHPTKTQDQTVITTRQTNNPVVRGYRVYYGESVDDSSKEIIDEINMEDAFGYDETEDSKSYEEANKILSDLGIEDPYERNDRLKTLGFDPKLDKQLKKEKQKGQCKNCFTKRRLSEIDEETENQEESIIRDQLRLSDEYKIEIINDFGSIKYISITFNDITKLFLMGKVVNILYSKKDYFNETFKVAGVPHFKKHLELDFDYFIFITNNRPFYFKNDSDKLDINSIDSYNRPSFLFDIAPITKNIGNVIFKEEETEDSLNESKNKLKDEDIEESPVNKILIRNLESIKRIAEKEGLDINKLIKILKTGE